MSAYDFNNTAEQQEQVFGPVPDGSKVLLEVHLEKPYTQASSSNPIIGKTQSGLFQINVSYHVVAGRYAGYRWYDSLLLPAGLQRVSLSDKQRKACDISDQHIRAIIEAHRNVSPKDTSPAAKSKRSINSWQELDKMTFPARLSINPNPRVYEGNAYYKNRISFIITPDKKEYRELMQGGEIINEGGAVTATSNNSNQYNGNRQQQDYGDPLGPAFENSQIADRAFSNNYNNDSMDDVPF